MIKTRFAPSPTGDLHIGAARTALFAYLFAKSQKGEFLLRIEDTDRERFVEGSTEKIVESLKWLGIVPDNILSYQDDIQSKRIEVYKKYAFKLIDANKAYICTCSKEKLTADREKQEKSKLPPRYERHCREANIDIKDIAEGGYVVRMKMPESGSIEINDLIRGNVKFDSALIDDQIILKSDGFPTYHLASVVDDHQMGITHVIRAEEWLSSTPKHIILFKMFGWEVPSYAHLPMILGSNKKKLSKRHGATSIDDFKEQGYLPEALINFMAFLGWNPKDDHQHHFTLETLVSMFKLDNVNKAAAIFDSTKLDDYNEFYIRNKQQSQFNKLLVKFGLDDIGSGESEIIKRGGYKTLKEAADYILKLRKTPEYESTILIFKKSDGNKTKKGLSHSLEILSRGDDWTVDNLQNTLSKVVEETGLSNGDVFWPIRVSLSGEERSPSPVELMLALGKDESLKRIREGLDKLDKLV